MSRSGDPPWILKWARLESSGRRLISSIGKARRIAFLFLFWWNRYFQNCQIKKKKNIFWDFSRFVSENQAGLESSGQIAYSWHWETKSIFLCWKKIFISNFISVKKNDFFEIVGVFDHFWHFLDFGFSLWIYLDFLDSFGFFLIFWNFLIFLISLDFFEIFIYLFFSYYFLIFFWIFLILLKLLRLLINVTKVTTEHHKWLKIGTKGIKALFLP